MKKIIVTLLTIVMALPALAIAEIDWAGMDVSAIQTEIDRARAEILSRDIKTAEKGTVLMDSDGLVVVLTSAEVSKSRDESIKLTLNYTVANNSDTAIAFTTNKCYLNGWEVSTLMSTSLDAGKKAKDDCDFYHIDVDADVNSYEDLEELQITFHTYNPETYHTITKDIECTIYFNK